MIIYLHGFNSSPHSFKANLLKSRLIELGRGAEFVCPMLPWQFLKASALIETVIEEFKEKPVCLVGSSLGGFYATHLAEKYHLPAILINPAVKPYQDLAKYLGPQRNLYTGEEYVLKAEYVNELIALDVEPITRLDRYLLLTQTGDEVLDYRQGVEKFAGCEQIVVEGGDHAFSNFAFYLPQIITFADAHPAQGIMRS